MKEYHRHSIRLKGYDYSQSGAYFITINTLNRAPLFGEIADGIMHPNRFGRIVCECWDSITEHFANVELDEFVAMPDHVHGIVLILAKPDVVDKQIDVGARRAVPLQNVVSSQNHKSQREQFGKPTCASIPTIIRSFKSAATKRINEEQDSSGCPVWQRNYYEHIIRDDGELNRIRQYIHDNPANWISDGEEPKFHL